MSQHWPLAILLVIYGIVAALFAIHTPPWQAPDEPAHYNYTAQVAQNGCCPTIEVGDWNSAYLEQLKSGHFAPDLLGKFATIQYEDHQPPLYYLMQSVVFKLSSGSLIAMRLFSALLGAGIVICAYFVTLMLLPERIEVALGAAALVGFLPQHMAVLASMNNDSLAGLEIGLTLVGILIYLKGGRVKPWHLGVLVGLGLLTKLSTLFLAGLVPVAILLKWWEPLPIAPSPYTERGDNASQSMQRAKLQPFIMALISFALPAVILGGLWSVHSIQAYGFPDVFGQRQHNLVVADQPRTADRIAAIGWGDYLRQGLETTFNSFWGQFGWMALPLPGWMYAAFLGLMIVGGSGLVLAVFRKGRSSAVPLNSPTEQWRRNGWIILGLTAILAVLAYLYYNTEFLQFQGRYMFSGIIPFAIGMALGVDAWRRLVLGRFVISRWLTVAVFLLLVPLDIYLILKVIEPLLKP
ncbi:MAG: DUF2142 domain-containing protein [Chloroflexota bacterium]